MNRDSQIERLASRAERWDIIVIGGGATGAGCAVDAASRGYSTLLIEQSDFGKGTSSRSTKLAHGGVRYLRKGALGLVFRALRERSILLKNAPHVVEQRGFVIPASAVWEKYFYGAGLKLYDAIASGSTLPRSRMLTAGQLEELTPTLATEHLKGGVLYFDGQFDDARLNINLIQTAVDAGAAAVNYMRAVGFVKDAGRISAVAVDDLESGNSYEVPCRVVINACGPFSDELRRLDDKDCRPCMLASSGIHVVVDRSFLPSDCGVLIPHTDDRRVLFAIPWRGVTLIGTTDSYQPQANLEPRATKADVDYVLDHTCRYLDRCPLPTDVRSVFAGIRPLVSGDGQKDTASISRDHSIRVAESGLVTISGGKWTTYRHMAEDTITAAAETAGLPPRPCATEELPVHGHCKDAKRFGSLHWYGSDAAEILALAEREPGLNQALQPDCGLLAAEVAWAARNEMARTVEDVLSRRSRVLITDARKALELAEPVAQLLQKELGKNDEWKARQIEGFNNVAQGYFYPEE